MIVTNIEGCMKIFKKIVRTNFLKNLKNRKNHDFWSKIPLLRNPTIRYGHETTGTSSAFVFRISSPNAGKI